MQSSQQPKFFPSKNYIKSKEEIPDHKKHQENNNAQRGNIRLEMLDPKFLTQKPSENFMSDGDIQSLFSSNKLRQAQIKALSSHLELILNINKNKNNQMLLNKLLQKYTDAVQTDNFIQLDSLF